MPNVSERQQLIQELEEALVVLHIQERNRFSAEFFRILMFSNPEHLLRDLSALFLNNKLHLPQDHITVIQSVFHNNRTNFLEAYQQIVSRRYLSNREMVPRAADRLCWLFTVLDDDRFRQEARMSRGFFFQLVNLIENHPIFHNNWKCPQRPVSQQLLVALRRLGQFGNGAAVGLVAQNLRYLVSIVHFN